MKLHLPKPLFTALLAAITFAAPAIGLTLTEGYHKTYSLSEKFSYTDANGNEVNYSNGTLSGYDMNSKTLTLNMSTTWTTDQALFIINPGNSTGTTGTYSVGLYATAAGNLNAIAATNTAWETSVITAAALAEEGLQTSITVKSQKANDFGTQITSASGDELYRKSGLRYSSGDYTETYLNSNIISAIVVTDVPTDVTVDETKYYASNYTGSWEQQFAKEATMAVTGLSEISAETNLGEKTAIIVGNTGQLHLNASTATLSVAEDTEIYIGNTSYQNSTEATYSHAALRFENANAVDVAGNIYLVDNATAVSTGSANITLSGQVTDKVVNSANETITTNSTLLLKGNGYNFAGGLDVTGLSLESGASVSISSDAVIGTLSAASGTVTLAENATLTLGNDTNASTHTIGTVVASSAGNTIHLNNKATLAGITMGTGSGTITLTGSGTYNLGASTTMTDVSLADTWEGSVKVTGTVSGEGDAATLSRYDIDDLNVLEALDTTVNGKVVLSGVNGYFKAAQEPSASEIFSADIVLENYELNGTSHAALTIDDGYSVDDPNVTGTQDRHSIIKGSISGSGDLEFAKKSSDAKYLIQGNVSGWNGTLKATQNTLYLVAGGDATTWNAAIIDKQGANNAGTIHLSVDNTGNNTTFSKEVSVSTLTVTERTSITLGGGTTEAPITHSIGTLSAGSGTVSVAENGTLSLGTATHSIGTLTGGGLVTTAGNLSITNAPADFTGALVVQGSTATVTNATSDFTLKNLTLDGSGSESGASFDIVARGTSGTTGYSYYIEQLTVSGTGTLANTNPSEAPGYQSQWNIGNLTNAEEGSSGVLNLNSWTNTTNRSIINLNGGDFAGEINLLGNSNTDTRKVALNVNAETAAADAVVSLSSSGQKVALGIGAKRVVLKGINGSAGSIISGAQAYHTNTTAYNNGNFDAIDTTFRTLVIDTDGTDDTAAVNSSTSATLGSYLNLEKQGAGTQTFSGDMSSFNGAIDVIKGTLVFTSGFTASSATISQGAELKLSDTATVTNGTMSQVKLNSTGISSADTTGATKGSISNANVALAQLAEDASFTIEDMTLSNTTITATTVDTKVNLQNVAATNLALAQGKFTMNAAPTVGTGGTTAEFGSGVVSLLTAGSASLTLNLDVMGAYESTGAVDNVTLTVTLAGITGDVSSYGVDAWKALVGFEESSWLGQALVIQKAEYTVVTEQTPATAGEGGVPTVNYGYASTGTNVGTLTITITGLNVPEPASATLGLAALMMLCARRRRRK